MANKPSEAWGPKLYESVTSLPPNRRYILTHDKNGKSVVHSSPPQRYNGIPGTGGMARSYATSTVPANLNGDKDIDAYLSTEGSTSYTGRDIVVPTLRGSNLVVVDLAPGGLSQMHRTISIDYSICTNGHIKMELDNGDVVDLKPGDHVIQRGTMHKWTNASMTEPARFVAVTLPCEPFEIPGKSEMLEEVHVAGSEVRDYDISKL